MDLFLIAWQTSHWTSSVEVYESAEALAPDLGVPVSKMEESIDYQASLLTAQNPKDGGHFPACPGGKSWVEAFGETGSGKNFCHSAISGTDFTALPSNVATVTCVIQCCKGNRGIDEDSAVLGSDSKPIPEAQQEGVTATTDSVASLLWFVRSSGA